jgi:hypothetical protein
MLALYPSRLGKASRPQTIPLHLLMRRDSYFMEGTEGILDTWKEGYYSFVKSHKTLEIG